MNNTTDGIGAILKRLSVWRLGEDVNLMEFSAGPSASPGGSSRSLLMLIVVTHAALLGYLLGASLLFKSGGLVDVRDLPLSEAGSEPRQVSLNKADREPIRIAVLPEPVSIEGPYARMEPVAEMLPTVALEPIQPQVAGATWPEDKAIQAPPPAAPPIAEPPHHAAPPSEAEEPPAGAPVDAAPPPALTPYMPGRRPPLELAETPPADEPESRVDQPAERVSLPALNPHPPARQLTPLSIAHVPPQVEEHALPTVPNAPATGVNETADFDPYTARAARWPEDSGHNAQPVVAEAQPEAVTEDPPAAPPPPPVLPVETVIPTPPQPVPSVAERLAMAATTPIAQTVETMMASGERIGDPGIIIERFIAREELVAMPLPERRGFLPGEVTTQELSASLGPDLTVLKGDSRSKLLDDYRAKVRAHLAGLKPPGGFGSDTIVVGFTITRSGKVSSAKILESRGIYHLEQGTLNAVYAAAPFPQPPRELKGTKFEFAIPFRFE